MAETLHLKWPNSSRLEGVQSKDIDSVWEEVRQIITPHVIRLGTHGLADVLENLKCRDWQLWVSQTEKNIEAVCITQINVFPKMKVCRVLLVAGEHMDNWLPFEDIIAEWAEMQGCKKLVGELRKGWSRKLTNWTFGNIVAERKL